jgi:hypothetical protein
MNSLITLLVGLLCRSSVVSLGTRAQQSLMHVSAWVIVGFAHTVLVSGLASPLSVFVAYLRL